MIKEESKIKYKVVTELRKLNYNFQYKGTSYLAYAIYLLYKMKIVDDYDLQNEVYPIVAKKYKQTVNNIKCNIVNATDKMYYDCEQKVLKEYMGTEIKPTPKIVIKSVLKNINSF